MIPILTGLQILLMNFYIAKIVFSISAEGAQNVPQFDEQLRLITADSTEEAFLKARTLGLGEEDSFYNSRMNKVKWEFINVPELIPLKNLENGTELYSRTHETDEATAYIHSVHQKAISIRMNTLPLF